MPQVAGVYWYITLRTRRMRIVEIRDGGMMSVALNLHSLPGRKALPESWKQVKDGAWFYGPLKVPEFEGGG